MDMGKVGTWERWHAGFLARILHVTFSPSVSLVDLVSIRPANLDVDLLNLLGRADPALAPTAPHLYAVTLRSRKPPKRRQLLDAWFHPMIVGQPLPTLPIWLTPVLRVMLPLETSYEATCRILGIA
jgi:hypothetical protein